MANKNHLLDDQIISSAMKEFMAKGYEKASLRTIAAHADVTVGAIYTRYPTKDALFCSLVQPLISRIEDAFCKIKTEYYENRPAASFWNPAESLEMESTGILHLLFDEYDRAVLLLCKSAGSSLEHFFDLLVQRKIEETLIFFESSNLKHPDASVLKLLITAQFHMYFQIINEGYRLEEAKEIMHSVMTYHTGGWLSLLRSCQEDHEQEESL